MTSLVATATTDACIKFNEQELNDILGLMDSKHAVFPSDLHAYLDMPAEGPSPGQSSDSACVDPQLESCCLEQPQHMQIARLHSSGSALMPGGSNSCSSSDLLGGSQSFPSSPSCAAVAAAAHNPSFSRAQPPPLRSTRVEKAQVQMSHSTVEKQRRDRINSLIDELRDLVPVQRAGAAPCPKQDGSAESRRPKHVVLADTITLLKNCKMSSNIGAIPCLAIPAVAQIKEEPVATPREPFTPTPAGAHTALTLDIPVSLNSFAGVTVQHCEQPGMMYVQVKCRDRQGLLFDIISALRMLPLQVCTAAATTTPDGMVRDVFQVRVEDPTLQPETVQNVVHDAVYHYCIGRDDVSAGSKRPKM